MSCCFVFTQFMAMQGNDVESAGVGNVAKYQEMCKTITQSVESTDCHDQETSLSQHVSALLPEMSSDDDIESILQQISEFLGVQIGEDSQSKDADGNDSLSVEEILKEAEKLIRVSSPFFEKTSRPLEPVQPLFEPIRSNLSRMKVEPKKKPSENASRRNVVVKEMPRRPSTHSVASSVKTDRQPSLPLQKSNSDGSCSDRRGKLVEQKSASIDNCDVDNGVEKAPGNVANDGDNELTMKDLHGGTYTVREITDKPDEIAKDNIDDHPCFKDELMNSLLKEINQLNSKIIHYEKLENQSRKNEGFASAERQQILLLQDEIKSQAELIEGYQHENQRLAEDIMAAKERVA